MKVIWTNETAIIVSYRRRGYRVQRTLVKRHLRSYTRKRWKGFTEFMFQASYCYDFKGPYYIQKPETTVERKLANKDLKKINKAIKPICKAKQELNNPMSRLRINRKNPGRIPQQRQTKANGKLTRGNRKGINQYQYQKQVLLPKLIPFAQRYSPEFLVIENKAPAHVYRANAVVISVSKVLRLLQCPNSPDLNRIEPLQFYLKRQTIRKGAP